MKKTIAALLLALCLCVAAAEEAPGFPGQPFPDFTATDTEGNAFLGDGNAATTVPDDEPRESSTRAFPVSAARALRVENDNIRAVAFRAEGSPDPRMAYVVYDDTAHLRLEAAAADNPADMVFFARSRNSVLELPALLDAERGAYVYDLPMPGAEDEKHYDYVCLLDGSRPDDPEGIGAFLISDDAYIEELAEDMRGRGYAVSWEYADAGQPESAPPQAYILHLLDQDGAPVPDMRVNFCTDETCTMLKSDENGVIAFDGAPDVYHVQLLKAPEGYSFDADFEMYTDEVPGEWVLRIRRD